MGTMHICATNTVLHFPHYSLVALWNRPISCWIGALSLQKPDGWRSPGSFEIISELKGNQRRFKYWVFFFLHVLSIGAFASSPSYCNQEQLCPAKALNSVGDSEPVRSPAHCTIGQSSFEMNESTKLSFSYEICTIISSQRSPSFCSTSAQHFTIFFPPKG